MYNFRHKLDILILGGESNEKENFGNGYFATVCHDGDSGGGISPCLPVLW
jgi:hypothetical protein